jgi:hypothetical protein
MISHFLLPLIYFFQTYSANGAAAWHRSLQHLFKGNANAALLEESTKEKKEDK